MHGGGLCQHGTALVVTRSKYLHLTHPQFTSLPPFQYFSSHVIAHVTTCMWVDSSARKDRSALLGEDPRGKERQLTDEDGAV